MAEKKVRRVAQPQGKAGPFTQDGHLSPARYYRIDGKQGELDDIFDPTGFDSGKSEEDCHEFFEALVNLSKEEMEILLSEATDNLRNKLFKK